MTRSRPQLARLAAILCALVLAACDGGPTAPTAIAPPQASLTAARIHPERGARTGTDATTSGTDTVITVFTVGPHGGRFLIGGEHVIDFPDHAICDPARSSYGPGTWDRKCRTLGRAITFTAKSWVDAQGHPEVFFSPEIRFAPTRDPRQGVVLYLKDWSAASDPSTHIDWCAEPGTSCLDDGKHRPWMQTQRDPASGWIYRIIEHFSGYNIAAG